MKMPPRGRKRRRRRRATRVCPSRGIALWALCTLGLLTSLPAGAPASEDTFDIEGFVVDDTNKAVSGATVLLEGLEIIATTDSLGGFVLHDVPSGEHRVTARVGCAMAGHVDALRVPRPVRVPLPIRLKAIDCTAPTSLDVNDERALVTLAVRWFTEPERRPVVDALLADGAIRLLSGGNVTATDVTLADTTRVPIEHLSQDDAFPEAIWLSLCITTPEERTALVRIVRASPPVPEELDVFIGDAALFTFKRPAAGSKWELSRQLVCLDTAPEPNVSVETVK